MRAFIILAALLAILAQGAAAQEQPLQSYPAGAELTAPTETGAALQWLEERRGDRIEVAQRCCRVCRRGKACGNSCINRIHRCTGPLG